MGVFGVFVWATVTVVFVACGSSSALDGGSPTTLGAVQSTSGTIATTSNATTVPTNQHPTTTVTTIPSTTSTQPPPTMMVSPITTTVAPIATDDSVPSPPQAPGPCTDADAPSAQSQPKAPDTLLPLKRIVIPTVCGDGRVMRGESCDDGNLNPADGCNENCQTEPYYECPVGGEACIFIGKCGDDVVAGPEQCELSQAPGCDMNCQVQTGWVCPLGQPCLVACGDGITAEKEQCDDGNNVANDACSPTCTIELDYCRMHGCPDRSIGPCGDGVVDPGEACDDGGASVTCSEDCQWLPQCDADTCAPLCGDGLVIDEQCDDGNLVDDDGCNFYCQIEPGFACTSVSVTSPLAETLPPGVVDPLVSECSALCGDGIVTAREACDLGELNGTSGAYCQLDCTLGAYCGDGVVDDGETCDDGLNVGRANDPSGCSPGCVNNGFCGDSIVQTDEECDSGRAYTPGEYGGCTSSCTLAARCGDGIVQACGGEQCDGDNGCVHCRHVTVK